MPAVQLGESLGAVLVECVADVGAPVGFFFGWRGVPSGGPGFTGGTFGCCFGGVGLVGTIGTVRPGTPLAYTRSSCSTNVM